MNLNEIATALKEFGELETSGQPTEPIMPLKCLGSQIPRVDISDDDTEIESKLTEQPQNLKFLASKIPQIPQDVTEDFGSEFIGTTICSAEEEQPEANYNDENEVEIAEQPQNLKFLASQIPQIPHEVTEDFGSGNEEEHPEEVKCLGSQIPQRETGHQHQTEMLSEYQPEESNTINFEREDNS